ncbi:MAG: CopG family ribbon-helix-helix protein [Bosea sp. (in: a-proteobacteria)]|jgi:predicted transcriptional regulator|uniref:CopG family ribbon-helix-helix protein n=1 Tax=Bosea sp. (in: a-proteobacteria) TaxID=1871050 RepID=UPI00226CBAEB|nr:CopG family ribbon-helix-helix protein [Bosea sp. (in: a-proteobacteria)]MBA4335586.1 CopG family transcriptional regulator [Methylobacterium sp.]MCZ8044978.1 CopG family ribbon-helix-helix protein [Beijerinckiaceae bacterium]MDP3602823.1 CopG family ribbon-helix-helix protein [Bosea sp. (in: a-proteobacteria)]
MTAAFTIRLDDQMLAKLDALAADTDRSRSWLAAKAIEDYLELNAWQIARIKDGIAEANRGAFASDEEVETVFAKYRAKPA